MIIVVFVLLKQIVTKIKDVGACTRMRNQIVLYLLKIGVRPHYKGFSYLVCALGRTMDTERRISMLELYDYVADEYGINPKRVERCIRTLVDMYYDTMQNPPPYKYTNSEFIYICTMHMKLQHDVLEG